MNDEKTLWRSNESTRLFFSKKPGKGFRYLKEIMVESIQPKQLTVNTAKIQVNDNVYRLEEIKNIFPRVLLLLTPMYFIDILLKSGDHLIIHHDYPSKFMEGVKEGNNEKSFQLLVAISQAKNEMPPPFDCPKSMMKTYFLLLLFGISWFIFYIVMPAIVNYLVIIGGLMSIISVLIGSSFINFGYKNRSYEGGNIVIGAGVFLTLIGPIIFVFLQFLFNQAI